MSIQDIGAIGELLAAIATIGTLIYLAQQIRQNTKALSAASIDSLTNHGLQELRWSSEILDLFEKSETDPESLTEVERRKILTWAIASIRNRQNEYFLWKHGSLSDDIWKASESILPGVISRPIVKSWFESDVARSVVAAEFYEYASKLVRDADQDFVSKFRQFRGRGT